MIHKVDWFHHKIVFFEQLGYNYWFYYQVDIKIDEIQYPKYSYIVRAFNNSVLTTGTIMGEKGMSSGPNVSTTPIMFYEHI